MRVSTAAWRLIFQSLGYRGFSASWKRAFLLVTVVLLIHLFVVFEFISSTIASGGHLRWNWVYYLLLNVPEHIRGTIDSGTPSVKPVPDLSDASRNDTLHCENRRIGIPLGRVDKFLPDDPFAWQRVSGRFYETYVFSAYYDDRLSSARVVIVGISDEYDLRESVSPGREFCQIWYQGDEEFDIVEAAFSFVPEHHDLRFAPSLHFCPLKRDDSVPLAVSLIVDRCRQSKNILLIQNHSSDQKKGPRVNYTVCISPLINSYNDYQQLVETVEVNRIFGAEEFLFYNHSTDSIIHPFLASYLEEGIARTIIPWKIPHVDIHYLGQVVALNDCLYRSMFRSRFLVFTDLDELIVPRLHRTWDEMLDAVAEKLWAHKDNGIYSLAAYIFRNTFFPKDWLNKSRNVAPNPLVRRLGLRTLQLNVREDHIYKIYTRSKYMVRSSVLEMVGIHYPYRSLPVYSPTVYVDPSLGLVHHYRDESVEHDEYVAPVFDPSIYRFQDLIISRTRDRYLRVAENNKRTRLKLVYAPYADSRGEKLQAGQFKILTGH